MKNTYDCQVLSKTFLAEGVFSLVVEKPAAMEVVKPGQFFNLKVASGDYPLLRRPISISFANEKALEFTVMVKGQGTSLLSALSVGSVINILGPLGNGYDLNEPMSRVLVVGGGIGVAPQMALTQDLRENGVDTKVLLGFKNEPYGLDTYFNLTDDVEIASETSIFGYRGFVTDLVNQALEAESFDMVFACGPHVMLKKIKESCEKAGVKVQLLMEERMACGVGACLVCTCATQQNGELKHLRTCKEGPVFYGHEVVFND